MSGVFESGEACGLPFMKFTLTYKGELSTGDNNPKDKWRIRKEFHPQLVELCEVRPMLKQAIRDTRIPARGHFQWSEAYHKDDAAPTNRDYPEARNLFAVIPKHGRTFLPIVRESMALTCGLDILFLRKEDPGNLVLPGGDVDNRLKVLFDALRMPRHVEEVVNDPTIEDPIYCLMEEDSLITAINVKTDRLLTELNSPPAQVHLIIGVDVRVQFAKPYNYAFLSD